MNREQNFWHRYGKLVIFSILLLLSTSAIIQYRDHQKTKNEQEASLIYEKMLASSRKQELSQVAELASNLTEKYGDTTYGGFGALMLARLAIEKQNPTLAIEQLKLAMRITKNGPVHEIAAIRLARVLLSEGKYEEALSVLPSENKKDQGFKVLVEELRGDIYYKQNDLKKAAAAYSEAIKSAPNGIPLMSLQLKYTDIKSQEDS